MTKKITILDYGRRIIGYTYFKRAKQLVKKGRANWVNGESIMLSAKTNFNEDDFSMDKLPSFQNNGYCISEMSEMKYPKSECVTSLSGLLKAELNNKKTIIRNLICYLGFDIIWFFFCSGVLDEFIYDYRLLLIILFVPIVFFWWYYIITNYYLY